MNKTNLLTAIIVTFLIASTAGATIFVSYYGKVNTSLIVSHSSVRIDGNDWNINVADSVTAAFGGTIVYGPTHDLHNYGVSSLTLNWNYTFNPHDSWKVVTIKCVDANDHTKEITSVSGQTDLSICFEYTLALSIQPGSYEVTETLLV